MTEIKGCDGKLYVSAIFDCFDSSVIGLAMDTNMKASLCKETLEMLLKRIRVSVEPLSIQTGESSIPASFTGKRYRNMAYNKVWTAQVAGATIMPGVRACGQEWKQNCYMIVMIQRKWLRMNLRQSSGDISPVTGITGGSAPLIEVFPQWSKDNNITLPWRKQHRVQNPWGKCVN